MGHERREGALPHPRRPYAADDAAAMLMTVTPEQLDALRRRWEKVNRRFVREYRLEESIEEQRRATGRRALSRIRDWIGHLDDEQEQKILAWASALPLIHGPRHEDRLRRQSEFLQLMSQRDDAGRFAARLRHWLSNWEEGRDPAYNRLFDEWTQQQADLYVAVYRILTPHQREAVARAPAELHQRLYAARAAPGRAGRRRPMKIKWTGFTGLQCSNLVYPLPPLMGEGRMGAPRQSVSPVYLSFLAIKARSWS